MMKLALMETAKVLVRVALTQNAKSTTTDQCASVLQDTKEILLYTAKCHRGIPATQILVVRAQCANWTMETLFVRVQKEQPAILSINAVSKIF